MMFQLKTSIVLHEQNFLFNNSKSILRNTRTAYLFYSLKTFFSVDQLGHRPLWLNILIRKSFPSLWETSCNLHESQTGESDSLKTG